MPELPEVETVRRDLSAFTGHKIVALKILSPKSALPSAAFLKKNLLGQKLTKIDRRGKLLILSLASGKFLLIHLKMTGQLIYETKQMRVVGGHSLSDGSWEKSVGGKLPNRQTRAIFDFENGGRLFFNDLRKFGYLKLVDGPELKRILETSYGPEPLTKELTPEYLERVFKSRRITIKAALLNQKLIAGLGNIYVDEALFAANIRPQRVAGKVSKKELTGLISEINRIIKLAIKNRGTTFSNYVDSRGRRGNFSRLLKVYGRSKEPCFVCGREISKIKLSGRGTHYCAHCQK